ncbi:hypothetical protein SAMN05443573_12843 [Celeribacter indicus]|nr:hypothetical protein SAMN05443573_12843 [Celeribacter indicus]
MTEIRPLAFVLGCLIEPSERGLRATLRRLLGR